jgi:sirohydrochlorin cobaltochelatase
MARFFSGGAVRGQAPYGLDNLSFQRNKRMKIPIVLTAFGTTTNALKTYDFMDKIIRDEFPGHEILWAFSSRMVKDRLKHKQRFEVRHLYEVLQALYEKGHVWAVAQSMHLLCGHEFYRMLEEVQPLPIRTSIGLPLLSSHEDYQQLARILGSGSGFSREETLVVVGHGTDHPCWSSYLALENILQEANGSKIYVGAMEGYPSRTQVLKSLTSAGIRKVRLMPLMLVAGMHFYKDLSNGKDSWRAVLEEAGMEVRVDPRGIGNREEVVKIFIDHIREALDVIPR